MTITISEYHGYAAQGATHISLSADDNEEGEMGADFGETAASEDDQDCAVGPARFMIPEEQYEEGEPLSRMRSSRNQGAVGAASNPLAQTFRQTAAQRLESARSGPRMTFGIYAGMTFDDV